MDLPIGFSEEGFLCGGIDRTKVQLREESAEWFSLAEDCNAALMATAEAVQKSVRDNLWTSPAIAVRILMRSCGALQAVVVLCERGMVAEARTLARSLVECAICIAALHEDPEKFEKILREDSNASQQRQRKFLIAEKLIKDDGQIKKIQNMLNEVGKLNSINLRKIAKMGPFTEYYLSFQRLSDDSSHLSARSLDRYVVRNADAGEFFYSWNIGESVDVDSTLYHSVIASLAIGVATTQLVRDLDNNAIFGALRARFDQMPPVAPI